MINKLKKADKPENILKAAALLNKGGVIIHPTETLYGFACSALMAGAIRRVDRIKGRKPGETYLLLIRDIPMALEYKVRFDRMAEKLARKFWPGPLTLVLPVDKGSPLFSLSRNGMVGLRVSSEKTVKELFNHIVFPLISTSVNRSGTPPLNAPRKIEALFGREADIILDKGVMTDKKPSTVAAVRNNAVEFIRLGAIPEKEIRGA
jgi:tRNA threonylcarbamoyl adenosine modification protein (Sua5/YciO/YrdC/YwlC family)